MDSETRPDRSPDASTEAQVASAVAPRRTSLRSISFGDPTAEGDTAFLFERHCFFETDIYQRCVELGAPLFVVGRRGSGKSATRMALARHFSQDRTNLTVVISPQSFHFAHAKALARAMIRETDVNWEFLFTSLWATTLGSLGGGPRQLLQGPKY
jgi:hypothetical protein